MHPSLIVLAPLGLFSLTAYLSIIFQLPQPSTAIGLGVCISLLTLRIFPLAWAERRVDLKQHPIRDCVKLLIEDMLSNPTKWTRREHIDGSSTYTRDVNESNSSHIVIMIDGLDSSISKDSANGKRETIKMNPAEVEFCREGLKKFKQYREEDVSTLFANNFRKL